MKEQLYIKTLEDRLHELVTMLTNHSLYGILSEAERKQLSLILQKAQKDRLQFKAA